MKHRLAGWLLCCCSFCFLGASPVSVLPFSRPVDLHVQGASLVSVLRNLTQEQGISAVIDPSISGSISGAFEKVDPHRFFKDLCESYNVLWTYDGNILYLDAGERIASKLVEAPHLKIASVLAALGELNLHSSNSRLSSTKSSGIFFVSGPVRYVSIVETLMNRMNQLQAKRKEREVVVRVFKLNHAWAYDLNFDFRDTSISIPGVASILKELLGNSVATKAPEKVGGGKQKKLNAPKGRPAAETIAAEGLGSAYTNITTDSRTNSIIIRDLLGNMPMYEDLIRKLDKPVHIIAITAAILDVGEDESQILGLESLSGSRGPDTLDASTLGGTAPNANAANLSARVVSRAGDFMFRLQALQSADRVKLLSRPSVLTFDNMQALITNERSIYIRVPGAYDTDLYNVTAGLSLRVIPHVIESETGEVSHIKLLVEINDGLIQSDRELSTDSNRVPSVEKNSLTTQTVLKPNQSLLIGGVYSSNTVESESGVPILKDFPIFGRFFRVERKVRNKSQRLFIITPRIVNIDAADGGVYKPYFNEGINLGKPSKPRKAENSAPQLKQAIKKISKHHELKAPRTSIKPRRSSSAARRLRALNRRR